MDAWRCNASWGGIQANTRNVTSTGAQIRNGAITTYSGARVMKAGDEVKFRFDVAFTPSKQLDMRQRYKQRYLQIGVHRRYYTPEAVNATGATVTTLHQGIGGIHNGTSEYDSCAV